MRDAEFMSVGSAVQLRTGAFVVSLDFELAWGTRGRHWDGRIDCDLDGTRPAIQELLSLFREFDVSATWVAVGALFLGGATRHPWLDDPQFDDVPLGDCRSHPHWYADDVLELLRSAAPTQDIGCHTLTHAFVQDTDDGRKQFDCELSRSVELFKSLGLPSPRSFIFPKHYMAHFELLRRHGFECYRGPEAGWFEHLPTKSLKAMGRLASARMRQSPSVRYPTRHSDGLWVIPSSQFYPSFRSVGRWLSVADRAARAIKGLNTAADKRGVFHLWTHPFNLGLRSSELIHGIRDVLVHAAKLREAGRLENYSMSTMTKMLNSTAHDQSVQSGTNA